MRWIGSPENQASDCTPSALIALMLGRRGFPKGTEQDEFLNPKLSSLALPERIPGTTEAVEILAQAIHKQSSVLIFSDYDVDGIVSATIMRKFLEAFGLKAVRNFIPDRKTEGYGLTTTALQRALAEGAKPDLFIALDCGTNSHLEIGTLQAEGIRTLIVDHHQLSEPTPQADALMNPQRGKEDHHLCTGGLVFKLCHAYLRSKGEREKFDLREVLDLVALATVADLVPLEKDNRIFVREGLRRLAQTNHLGLRRLIEVSGAGKRPLTSFTLGFQIGPRINAGGRVGDANAGLKLLLSQDATETAHLARDLDLQNRKRQELEAMALQEAEEQVGEHPEALGIVTASRRWHPGVVGIVAARLARKFYRPCFVVALGENGSGRGSGRSISGLSLMDGLRACSTTLKKFGGHDAAAGIEIEENQLADFTQAFQVWLKESISPDLFEKTLNIEMLLQPEHLTADMARAVGEMSPFGRGNPEPVFQLNEVAMTGTPKVFAERHLKFRARSGGKSFEVIGFDFAKRPPDRPLFDLAGAWEWDDYTNGPRWRMVDWR